MFLRYAAVLALVATASGCVYEHPYRERRVVVERPAYAEVIAPQPPPVQYVEVEPRPRPGYVWARGYWNWERAGYRYVHPYWEQRGNSWHWHQGEWAR
jgi:hypothetical protein